MPRLQLHLAQAHEERQLFTWMHEAWPHPEGLAKGLAQREAGAAHPWAQKHLQRWYLSADGEPVSACALFDLKAMAHGQPLVVRGFGSVVTPAHHRSKGYARAMLEGLMAPDLRLLAGAAAPRVAQAALLYTDIGTPYYASLGFEPAPLMRAWACAQSDQAQAWRRESEADQSARWARRAAWQARQAFCLDRSTAEEEAFWVGRGDWQAWAWAPGGGPAMGHAWLHPGQDRVHLGEAIASEGQDLAAFQASLPGLASALGKAEVGTWVSPGLEPQGWASAPMPKGYPMLCGLGGHPTPSLAGPWWPADYF